MPKAIKLSKQLYPYQVEALDFLKENNGGYLHIGMRLGKTLITCRFLKAVKPKRTLIISPISAMSAWERELMSEKIPYTIIKGSRLQKEKILMQNKDKDGIFLINKDGWYYTKKYQRCQSCTMCDICGKGNTCAKKDKYKCARCQKCENFSKSQKANAVTPLTNLTNFDGLIVDEAHCLKNPKSNLTRWLNRTLRYECKYKVLLSGTPIEKDKMEFIPQLLILDRSKKYLNYWKFTAQHAIELDWGLTLSLKGEEILNNAIDTYVFRYDKSDEFLTQTLIPVTSEPELIFHYKNTKKTWTLPNRIELSLAVQMFHYLRLISSGVLTEFTETPDETKYYIHDYYKLHKTLEIIKANPNKKIVIFFSFRMEMSAMRTILEQENIDYIWLDGSMDYYKRKAIEDEFQNKTNIMLSQIECAKTGLNLVCADISIVVSLPTSSITWRQMKERICDKNKNIVKELMILYNEKLFDKRLFHLLEKKGDTSIALDMINFIKNE